MKSVFKIVVWTTLLLALSFVYQASDEAAAKEFTDVPKKHPNYTAIQEMQKAGFINGYPDGKFRPNDPVSRKHVASLLDKALNFKKPATAKLVFGDVPKNHPYYAPIMKLYNEGIISGAENGKFNPDASVTRIQMAKMLDLAFDFNMTDTVYFEDLNGWHWGYLHANALYSNGVTKGDHGKFLPNQSVTRAHYAEFLHRAMQIGKPPAGNTVSKEKALDLVHRMPHLLEVLRIQGKEEKKTFSQIRSKLLPYATERFTDGLLKTDYPYVCTACDSFLFPYFSIELSMRFNYSQPDPNTLKVRTILLNSPGPMSGGGFVDYMFKKEKGTWKMHDYTYTQIGKKNFELTKEEAKRIVQSYYSYEIPSGAAVTYVSTSRATDEDPVTKEKYQYDQYKFTVQTSNGRVTMVVNSNDGWAD